MRTVDELILHYDGQLYNMCYEVIKNSTDLKGDFQKLCQNYTGDPESKEIKIKEYINEEEYQLFYRIYKEKVEGIITEIINKVNYGVIEESDFYSELFKQYEIAFNEPRELAISFEITLNDDRIPFLFLGEALSMPGEMFKKYVEKNDDTIKKIVYALNSNYRQKTEEASVILSILDDIEGYNDRVVVFSVLLDLIKRGGIATILKDVLADK